jgi:hypothetical protein
METASIDGDLPQGRARVVERCHPDALAIRRETRPSEMKRWNVDYFTRIGAIRVRDLDVSPTGEEEPAVR